MFTPYQKKQLAWELIKRHSSSDEEKLTSVLSEVKVDLNPHQVEAVLFAFRSPLSMGAILAEEVDFGKTIEAALVIGQKWAERKKHILIISPAALRKQWNVKLEDKFFLPSIILDNKNYSFQLLMSPTPTAPVGIYTLTKESINGYIYRSSHPLAKWAMQQAITPPAEIEFDYTQSNTKVSVIEQNRGNSGYIATRLVQYSSLGEIEEHVVLAVTDGEGNRIDDDFAKRLFALPAKMLRTIEDNRNLAVYELLKEQQDILNERLEVRDSELVNDEVVKIENWAEDNRKELQRVLAELDKAIDEKTSEFIRERNIRNKLAIQKEKDALADKRDAAWREYDGKREELKAEKNRLVTQLYEMADGKIEVIDEYLIKWRIK